MKVKVKFYGIFKGLNIEGNKDTLVWELNKNSKLRDLMEDTNISQKQLYYCNYLINGKPSNLDDVLNEDDIIIIFPILGGG